MAMTEDELRKRATMGPSEASVRAAAKGDAKPIPVGMKEFQTPEQHQQYMANIEAKIAAQQPKPPGTLTYDAIDRAAGNTGPDNAQRDLRLAQANAGTGGSTPLVPANQPTPIPAAPQREPWEIASQGYFRQFGMSPQQIDQFNQFRKGTGVSNPGVPEGYTQVGDPERNLTPQEAAERNAAIAADRGSVSPVQNVRQQQAGMGGGGGVTPVQEIRGTQSWNNNMTAPQSDLEGLWKSTYTDESGKPMTYADRQNQLERQAALWAFERATNPNYFTRQLEKPGGYQQISDAKYSRSGKLLAPAEYQYIDPVYKTIYGDQAALKGLEAAGGMRGFQTPSESTKQQAEAAGENMRTSLAPGLAASTNTERYASAGLSSARAKEEHANSVTARRLQQAQMGAIAPATDEAQSRAELNRANAGYINRNKGKEEPLISDKVFNTAYGGQLHAEEGDKIIDRYLKIKGKSPRYNPEGPLSRMKKLEGD